MKVIIIGGGIAGLTCARACLDAGLEVRLYERRSLEGMLSGPGGIFIQRNAMRVYQLLDLSDRLYQQGGKVLRGGFFNQQSQPLYINDPKFVQAEDLGVCLLRPALQQILYEALPPGTVRPGVAFEYFENRADGVRIFFQDGHTAEGDLLVGADGLYSKVRARLNGQEHLEKPIYSGMCCWRGCFNGAGLPLDPQYSWGELWGKGDRFGYFHVGGNQFSFYAFANAPKGETDEVSGGSLNVLRSRFSHYGNPVPAILAALENQPIYRDDIFDRLPLGKTWGQGRVTLIGDATHPVQPNLGQGGCMAIEDAFELANKLTQLAGNTPQTTIPSLLRQFEASRSDRVTRVFNTSRQVGQLAQTDTAIGGWLRNRIYKLTPTWLADLQFKWLFDYTPEWHTSH
jgi:2-polyprenyl-6-methoxyphenol hydroxylase-like FAD-dependent oxidoreductase